MEVDIQDEHRWLERFTGDWEIIPDPNAVESERTEDWRETGRMMNGVWLVVEGRGQMPGGSAATTQMTLGYNNAKGKFVGIWVGSMMAHLWIYEGNLSADGKALALDSEGPDWENPEVTLKYQDVYRFEDDGTRSLTARVQKAEGVWQEFMMGRYRRI